MSAVPVSRAELDFTLEALRRENIRVDGRALTAYRRFGLRFGAVHGEVEVNFGPTRALAVCSGEIITPPPERPNEGRIVFNVEYGPIASPKFEVGKPSAQATTVSNFVERLLKGSRAIDAEALCIVGGQKVWSIRVDVRALDDDGNLSDVCGVAALCSILHFRKADVDVTGGNAVVHSAEERVPVPLSIHHLPVPVSFALFMPSGGKEVEPAWILDPNRLEEAAMAGVLCIAVNQHGELCGIHKPGGIAVEFALIEHCVGVATARAKELTSRIQSELEADLAKRKQARRNVHQRYAQTQLLSVDGLDVGLSKVEEGPVPAAVAARAPRHPTSSAALSARAQARAAAVAASAAEAAKAVAVKEAPEAAEPTQAAESPLAMEAAVEASAPTQVVDGYDISAELEAVEAEAAELEEQLRAAAASGLW